MLRRLLAATALALLAAAAPAAAAEPIMPLSEVQAGMRCTGLTVVQGVDIASFDVEVVDVVAGDAADAQPLILVRVSGPIADASGIAEGFSGSPVVCDGRIAGAIAYGTGDFGNRLGFATPIESVIGEPVPAPPGARRDPALLRRARPLATPVAVSGVAPAVFAPFARAARHAGIDLESVPAAPIGDRFGVQTLQPGSSLAVGLASGDVTAGAIGTVTYVDGDRVWGFGHPFEAAGRRSLLLQDAWVYTVIDNPLDLPNAVSTKLAAPGHDLGTLTFDGRNGVAGVTGTLPPRTRLRITAHAAGDPAPPRLTQAEVADETDVGLPDGVSPLSVVAPMTLAQAGYVALDGSPALQTAQLCVRIRLRELARPAGFCNRYVGDFGTGRGTPGGPYANDLSRAIDMIDTFRYGRPHILSVDATLELAAGLDQAFLLGVHGPRTLQRGATVELRLDLQRYRGARLRRIVRLHVPRDAPRGPATLALTGTPADGAGSAEALVHVGSGAGAGRLGGRTLAGLARRIGAISRFDGVYGALRAPGAAAASGRRPLYRDPQLRISGSASYAVRVR